MNSVALSPTARYPISVHMFPMSPSCCTYWTSVCPICSSVLPQHLVGSSSPDHPSCSPLNLFSILPPAHQPNCFPLFSPSAGSSLLIPVQWFSFSGTFSGSGRAILGPPRAISLVLVDGSPCSVPASLTHVVSRGMACGCLILGSYPDLP